MQILITVTRAVSKKQQQKQQQQKTKTNPSTKQHVKNKNLVTSLRERRKVRLWLVLPQRISFPCLKLFRNFTAEALHPTYIPEKGSW